MCFFGGGGFEPGHRFRLTNTQKEYSPSGVCGCDLDTDFSEDGFRQLTGIKGDAFC